MPEAFSDLDDPTLIQALRARDADGLRVLYARFSDRVFRFLLRMTGKRAVADDLHQETWLAAARHASTLRVDSDLAAWLFTIARNKHRSWRRWTLLGDRVASAWTDDVGWDATRLFGGGGHVGSAHGFQPGFQPGSSDGVRDLERSLARLAPALREVLVLVGCEELESAQAALILGITPEAVRQRVSRARAALRRVMNADDHDLAAARAKRQDAGQGAGQGVTQGATQGATQGTRPARRRDQRKGTT